MSTNSENNSQKVLAQRLRKALQTNEITKREICSHSQQLSKIYQKIDEVIASKDRQISDTASRVSIASSNQFKQLQNPSLIESKEFRRVFAEMKVKLDDLAELETNGFKYGQVDQYVHRFEFLENQQQKSIFKVGPSEKDEVESFDSILYKHGNTSKKDGRVILNQVQQKLKHQRVNVLAFFFVIFAILTVTFLVCKKF